MNNDLQESKTHITARRRLVRGVFAAPAALTLYSGGAFAAASMSCVAKDVSAEIFPGPSMDADTYVRVQLWNLTEGQNVTAWVSGAELAVWQAPMATSPPFIGLADWQCFSVTGSSNFTLGQVISTEPAQTGYTLTHDGMWVALKIDGLGNIVGVEGIGPNTSGASAVHGTCWTSFRTV